VIKEEAFITGQDTAYLRATDFRLNLCTGRQRAETLDNGPSVLLKNDNGCRSFRSTAFKGTAFNLKGMLSADRALSLVLSTL
jgi:hypothetical protein